MEPQRPAPSSPLPHLGPYRVTGELGRGGMGVVYRAVDAAGREVALKTLSVRLTAARRERFLREGRVTAALSHPGIVRVHACGEDARGHPWLAYELIEGARALDEAWVGRPLPERVALVRDAARALGHAHAQGVVHRDVKPGNILVDASGRVRVTDFGLAFAEGDARLTQTCELLGTPSYMAPELWSGGRSATAASDVWALGVVLFHALTDRVPFAASTPAELAGQILTGAPPAPSRVATGVPAALDAVCARALSRAPEARFADGAAFADAVDAAVDAAGAGRRPAAAAAAVAAAVLLGVAAALATFARAPLPPATPHAERPRAGQPPAARRARRAAAAVAEAQDELAAGRPGVALDALLGVATPAANELRARALLELGRPGEALEALASLPETDARAALRREATFAWVEVLASEGRQDEAGTLLTAWAARLGAGGRQVRAYGAALLGDVEGARPLAAAGSPHSEVFALVEALEELAALRRAIQRDPFQYRQVVLVLPELGRRAASQAQRAAKVEGLGRAVALRAQAALIDAAGHVGVGFSQYRTNDAMIDAVLAGASAIQPSPRVQQQVSFLKAYRTFGRTRDGAGQEDPLAPGPAAWGPVRLDPAQWAGALSPELQSQAHSLWFLKEPSLGRVPAAERALALPRYDNYPAAALEREVLLALVRLLTIEASQAHAAGDGERGVALARRAVVRVDALLASEVTLDRDAARFVAGAALLVHGALDRARDVATPIEEPELRGLLLGEAALAAGDLAAAAAALEPLKSAGGRLARAHLLALEGRRGEATRLAAEVQPDSGAGAVFPWHTPARIQEVLAGGWWPGRR